MPDPGLATRLYGGRDLDSATNIVFTNGLLDPWSSGGVLKSGEAKGGVVAIIIPEVTTAGSSGDNFITKHKVVTVYFCILITRIVISFCWYLWRQWLR